MIILFHGIVLVLQAEPALYHPRIDDGYFGTWKDVSLFVIFVVYTYVNSNCLAKSKSGKSTTCCFSISFEAFARMIATGLVFDPELVSVTDASGNKLLLSHSQILSMRLKDAKTNIFRSSAWGEQSPGALSEGESMHAQLHGQQAWRAHSSRPAIKSDSTSKGRSIFIKELPFEKAIQRQRSMALYSRPYLRHSWQ